jgi:membrane-bound ClpP family serine protease
MSWTIIIILILVGLLFLILEVVVIPGTTVVGFVGFALMVFAVWQTYIVYGSTSGHLILGGTVLISLVGLRFALRSKTWDKVMLKSNIDSRANIIPEGAIKVGDVGKSVSRIVPGGKAIFNNEYFEVCSSGEFIDPGHEIEVVKIEHNKIFVKIIN